MSLKPSEKEKRKRRKNNCALRIHLISSIKMFFFCFLSSNLRILVPRYVRINTLKCTIQGAVRQFISEGWNLVKVDQKASYEQYIEIVKNLKEGHEFLVDFHLEYVLVFPSRTEFHDHVLVRNGSVLLQDKVCIFFAKQSDYISMY